MSEVLLCNRPLDAQQFNNSCGFSIDQLLGCGCAKPTSVFAHTPYLIGGDASDASILSQLSSPPVARGLTDLSLAFGSDSLLPLAAMRDKMQEAGVGLLGEAAGLTNKRGNVFVSAVRNYQKALLEYRKAVVADAKTKSSARQAAQRAFEEMQREFRAELNTVTAQFKARRGTPLTDPQRAINIATSSRDVAKLHVANQVEASSLVKFTRHAKVLGSGLAVIDFGSKVGNIHNEYKAGGDWHRQMFIESTSFVAGAGAAYVAGSIGGTALSLLIMATPVGWVGLVVVVGGLALAGIAAGASITANSYAQKSAGNWYDSTMAAIGSR